MMKKIKRIIIYCILTYPATGLIYGITGIIYRLIVGKTVAFLGIPLDIVFWPWMVYADIKNIGVMPQDILAVVTITFCIMIFIRRESLLSKKQADA